MGRHPVATGVSPWTDAQTPTKAPDGATYAEHCLAHVAPSGAFKTFQRPTMGSRPWLHHTAPSGAQSQPATRLITPKQQSAAPCDPNPSRGCSLDNLMLKHVPNIKLDLMSFEQIQELLIETLTAVMSLLIQDVVPHRLNLRFTH
jgi:hypothetical protein